MKIGWIRTFTGKHVSLLQPTVAMFDIRDVAHHLAQEPRWGGACRRHYTVAEHQIWVARIVKVLVPGRDDLVLDALIHDGEEAYTKDIQTPHKVLLPKSWAQMSDNIRSVFRQSLGLPGIPSRESLGWTKVADSYAAWSEERGLMAPCADAGQSGMQPPRKVLDISMHEEIKIPQPVDLVEASYLAWAKHLLKR